MLCLLNGILWNRNLPHFSPLHTDGFSLTCFFMATRIKVWYLIFSFASSIFNNSRPFCAVINDGRDGKFYQLPAERRILDAISRLNIKNKVELLCSCFCILSQFVDDPFPCCTVSSANLWTVLATRSQATTIT